MRTLAEILLDGEELSALIIRREISQNKGFLRLRELTEEYQARKFWIKTGARLEPLKEYE